MPATSTSRRPVKVDVGGVRVMPRNSKGPKMRAKYRPVSPSSPRSPASTIAASSSGGVPGISSAQASVATMSAPVTSSLP